jgi:hypothetical protein
MREHLALVAVVIERMGGTARDVREVALRSVRVVAIAVRVMLVRRRVAIVVPKRRSVLPRRELQCDRRQDPDRRPCERKQCAPRDPRARTAAP